MDEQAILTCMEIITNTGSAKSSYIEAIHEAKKGGFEQAEAKMNEGDEFYAKAHEVHTSMIQKEAGGEKTEFSLILMHAEDQMAGTEMAKVLATEVIDVYKKLLLEK
ncbi:PTS lactose/cellobiose transporter subunit IIA [Brotaphodocola sp.]|uniref:PTS lactose/cellobiose transporter subunit IIA n=1 Tax=Brotaphodocola sp. TaxID=3073577 RepID=UPI003D7DA398